MAIAKKMAKRGFTLIELMIVVVIIGILAALAIYGVQKYVANSKSAEARMMLGRMSKDMLTFFEGEDQSYAVLSFGESAGISRSLCPAAAALPAAVPAAEKTLISPASFDDGAGWSCMKTTITTPVYYQYAMTSSQTGSYSGGTLVAAAADDTFSATATGDLDGDTSTSLFTMAGTVRSASNQLVLVLATTINEQNPEE